jgi:hypothetical protein
VDRLWTGLDTVHRSRNTGGSRVRIPSGAWARLEVDRHELGERQVRQRRPLAACPGLDHFAVVRIVALLVGNGLLRRRTASASWRNSNASCQAGTRLASLDGGHRSPSRDANRGAARGRADNHAPDPAGGRQAEAGVLALFLTAKTTALSLRIGHVRVQTARHSRADQLAALGLTAADTTFRAAPVARSPSQLGGAEKVRATWHPSFVAQATYGGSRRPRGITPEQSGVATRIPSGQSRVPLQRPATGGSMCPHCVGTSRSPAGYPRLRAPTSRHGLGALLSAAPAHTLAVHTEIERPVAHLAWPPTPGGRAAAAYPQSGTT